MTTTLPAGWMPIESAPKDGKEFLARWGRQGGSVEIVNWNKIHGHFASKGKALLGFASNATHWAPLPAFPGTPPASTQDDAKDEQPYCYALEERGEHNGIADVLLDVEYNGADSFSHGRKGGFPLYRRPAPAAGDARDAARYRWLRDPQSDVALVLDKRTGYVPEDERIPGIGGYHTYEYRAGEELDAAIDEAIAAQQGKGGNDA